MVRMHIHLGQQRQAVNYLQESIANREPGGIQGDPEHVLVSGLPKHL